MKKLEKLIKSKNISINKFANMCGISRTMFYETFRGDKIFSHYRLDVALKACTILECKLSDLVEDDDPNYDAIKKFEETISDRY